MTSIFDKIAESGLINSAIPGMAFSGIYSHQSCQPGIPAYFQETLQQVQRNGCGGDGLHLAPGDLGNEVHVLQIFHVLHVLIQQ